MTPTEIVKIAALVAQMCPQQTINSHTAEAWGLVIGHLQYDLAHQAVVHAARESAFIAPCDIISAVKSIETQRMREFGALWGDVGQAPPEIANDDALFDKWYRQRLADIKSGVLTRDNDPLQKELTA